MDLKELQVVEVKGIRTLTSKQLAECYGTTTDIIKKNFSRNRERYVEGKHYGNKRVRKGHKRTPENKCPESLS